MQISVIHNGVEVTATSQGLQLVYSVEYKDYSSLYSPDVTCTTLEMIKDHLELQLKHLRWQYTDVTHRDTSILLDTFIYTLKTTIHADPKQSISA